MSFGQTGKYFSEFLQPKKFNGVIDFLTTGLLPRLDDMCGFYRRDYLAHCDMKADKRPAYDAVFLTHAHADHSSYIHFLRQDIPIYASKVTRQILYAIEVTSSSGFTDFTAYTETFQVKPKQKGDGANGSDPGAPIEIQVPPIVASKMWDIAQQRLSNNKALHRTKDKKWLLQGLIKCGSCGLNYRSETNHNHRYYSCRGKLKVRHLDGSARCKSRTLKADWLEGEVWERIEALIDDPNRLEPLLRDTVDSLKSRVEELEAKD